MCLRCKYREKCEIFKVVKRQSDSIARYIYDHFRLVCKFEDVQRVFLRNVCNAVIDYCAYYKEV